ncbi:Ribosome-binding factor A [Phycisphaerae bacterium RAS1]|nr:Ribosome-binding factor A [Phycisphaerae bacterium RAS1]
MSYRLQRIASVVRSVVAEAIQRRLNDPRIEPLTSITRVEITPDLTLARVYVSVMAPEARRKLTVTALSRAAGRIRTLLAEHLTMRTIPRVEFHLDDSLRRGLETLAAIDEAMAEIEAKPPAEAPTGRPADEAEQAIDTGRDPAVREDA